MSEDQPRRRLGRGLAALIGEVEQPLEMGAKPSAGDGKAALDAIVPNRRNPRRSFDETELADLARSIREHGLVQPIVVRPAEGGGYEIIAGERRWRAAREAGLAEIPVIVRDVPDKTALELAIVENVQRADLNPVEEAQGYRQLVEEHSYTQADLGQVVGKSRSHVANTLRLLKLPDAIQDMLADGRLSAGHARTLVTAADPEALSRRIVAEGLSVRQAEALAQAPGAETAEAPKRGAGPKDADTLALEKLLSDQVGLRVAISRKPKGGELRISYKTLEQLDDICHRLKG